MLRNLVIIIFLLHSVRGTTHAQHFIGLHKDEIAGVMKESYSNFKQDKDVVNPSHKYLKYEDFVSEQTVLFFLSDDDRCTLVRWMSAYSNINDMISHLNDAYQKTDDKTWEYKQNGKAYSVKLEDGEWFFTVTIRPKAGI